MFGLFLFTFSTPSGVICGCKGPSESDLHLKLFVPFNKLTAGYKSSHCNYSREIDRERSSASHRHQFSFSADVLNCCEHFLARTHISLVPSGKGGKEIQSNIHAALKVNQFYSVEYSGTYFQICLFRIIVCQEIHWGFCSWCEDKVSASMENGLCKLPGVC